MVSNGDATATRDRPLRVLLADDAPDIVTILRAWLEADRRFEVCGEADTLARAVRAAASRAADAVVLDWSMPPGSGDVTDAAAAVRQIVAHRPGSRVVVLSGASDPSVADAALAAGASRHLAKGTPLSTLSQALLTPARAPAVGPGPRRADTPVPAPTSPAGSLDADALHDLRTPLTALQGYAATLPTAAGRGDEVLLAHLAAGVRRNVLRLTLLLDALALEAEVVGDRLALRPEPVDLGALAAETAAALEPLLTTHPLSIEVAGHVVASVDPDRARELLVHLLANAVRSAPPDTGIDVALGHEDDDGVVVRCTDHGPPVGPDRVPQALARRSTMSRSRGGLGLDLYLVDGLARAHGGRVDGVAGHDTTTWVVHLPVAGS